MPIFGLVTTGSVSDAKKALMMATVNGTSGGFAPGSILDLEHTAYAALSGLSPASAFSTQDHKKAFYALGGFTGPINSGAEIAFMVSKGAVGSYNSDIRLDFYRNRSLVP